MFSNCVNFLISPHNFLCPLKVNSIWNVKILLRINTSNFGGWRMRHCPPPPRPCVPVTALIGDWSGAEQYSSCVHLWLWNPNKQTGSTLNSSFRCGPSTAVSLTSDQLCHVGRATTERRATTKQRPDTIWPAWSLALHWEQHRLGKPSWSGYQVVD